MHKNTSNIGKSKKNSDNENTIYDLKKKMGEMLKVDYEIYFSFI